MMKAAVLTLDGFEIRDVAKPTIDEDEVLVKTLACGVCSGDVFVYRHRADYVATCDRLGHEPTGRVVAVGKNVAGIESGDIVTALAMPAYAEYFKCPANLLVKLPPGIDPSYALGEAIACCVHAAGRFGIMPGDKVAIAGCGFMGLICQQLAINQGAGFICALDPLAERLELSQKFGANVVYDPAQTSASEIAAAQGDFDVVIEAAGVQDSIDIATELVKQHGRIILIGYHQSNNGWRTVNMQQWNYKAIDVINGHVRRQDEKVEAMRQGMALMERGILNTESLVTIYPFEEAERAFRDLDGRVPGLFKAVLSIKNR